MKLLALNNLIMCTKILFYWCAWCWYSCLC